MCVCVMFKVSLGFMKLVWVTWSVGNACMNESGLQPTIKHKALPGNN